MSKLDAINEAINKLVDAEYALLHARDAFIGTEECIILDDYYEVVCDIATTLKLSIQLPLERELLEHQQ